jgi:hypothetical protein
MIEITVIKLTRIKFKNTANMLQRRVGEDKNVTPHKIETAGFTLLFTALVEELAPPCSSCKA